MVSPVKTEAIVVWDIENTRVPVVLRNHCFEIVQFLVADVQERNPASTVSKVRRVRGSYMQMPANKSDCMCRVKPN